MDTTWTPATTAAIWSAVAASSAALASLLIMLIQRRNLLESVRPEIVLISWGRVQRGEGTVAHEVITFETIKNVGRGAALHIDLGSLHMMDDRPTAILSTTRLSILAPNESSDVKGEIQLWWQNVAADDRGHKHLPITIRISCLDSRGMRHQTMYSFLAVELKRGVGVMDEIAPGVGLLTRITTTRSVWSLKAQRKLARIPVIGRFFRDIER